MTLRRDLPWIIKAGNGRANNRRFFGPQEEELRAAVLAEMSDPLILHMQFGGARDNLEVVPFEASPSNEGRSGCPPAIVTMAVEDALAVELTTKPNGATKAASLDRNAIRAAHSKTPNALQFSDAKG
ncbi:MAG TPA: hypothetical protein VF585_06495 [Chthoniobacterales bacterium]|jgi:hypothetical protein